MKKIGNQSLCLIKVMVEKQVENLMVNDAPWPCSVILHQPKRPEVSNTCVKENKNEMYK